MSAGNKPIDYAKALKEIKDNMNYMVEFEKTQAVLTRYKYDALIEQEFTEAQALELCKR